MIIKWAQQRRLVICQSTKTKTERKKHLHCNRIRSQRRQVGITWMHYSSEACAENLTNHEPAEWHGSLPSSKSFSHLEASWRITGSKWSLVVWNQLKRLVKVKMPTSHLTCDNHIMCMTWNDLAWCKSTASRHALLHVTQL